MGADRVCSGTGLSAEPGPPVAVRTFRGHSMLVRPRDSPAQGALDPRCHSRGAYPAPSNPGRLTPKVNSTRFLVEAQRSEIPFRPPLPGRPAPCSGSRHGRRVSQSRAVLQVRGPGCVMSLRSVTGRTSRLCSFYTARQLASLEVRPESRSVAIKGRGTVKVPGASSLTLLRKVKCVTWPCFRGVPLCLRLPLRQDPSSRTKARGGQS